MKNSRFDKMILKMAQAEGVCVPQGFEERLEAAIADARSAQARVGNRRNVRIGRRAACVALAAVTAVILVTGTALAASPQLRELLWGEFEPLAKVVEPDGENTDVYDGVEARITSALTDGTVAVYHVEFRDLEGDRMARLYDEYLAAEDREAWELENLDGDLLIDGKTETDRPAVGFLNRSLRRVLGFDSESGVLTVEYTMSIPAYSGDTEQATICIKTGALATERLEREIPREDVGVSGEGAFTVPETGWTLRAAVETLPVRHGENGSLRVSVSGIGMTVYGGSGDQAAVWGEDISVTLADGSVLTFDNGGLYTNYWGGLDGDAVNTVISFSRPIDLESITEVNIGGCSVVIE